MPELPTVPPGVLSPSAKRTYDLGKWLVGLIGAVLGVVSLLLYGLSAVGLVSFGAQARKPDPMPMAAPAPVQPPPDWPGMKAALDDLRRQATETSTKLERLDDRLRDVQVDVGALKASSGGRGRR